MWLVEDLSVILGEMKVKYNSGNTIQVRRPLSIIEILRVMNR